MVMPFQPRGAAPSMMPPTPSMAPVEISAPMPGSSVEDAIRAIANQVKPQPAYRPGYKPPKQPTADDIQAKGDRMWQEHAFWRSMIVTTQRWLRDELRGCFSEDEEDRRAGFQEEYPDGALKDKRNLIVAKLASMKLGFKAPIYDDGVRSAAQLIEDACRWLRDEQRYRWSAVGNMPLEIDEAQMFTDRGMFCSRQIFRPQNPDYPLLITLVDPIQVYPVFDGVDGLKAVYRVYYASLDHIATVYGDFSDKKLKQLESKHGKVDDRNEVRIVEYWDTWYRSVNVGGESFIDPVAHEYGYVPWTVQYGGLGEGLFMRVGSSGMAKRRQDGTFIEDLTPKSRERLYQAVPLIFHDIKAHEVQEAVMARVITGFKKEINPPMIIERATEVANKPRPEWSNAPGAINELDLGNERANLAPMPTASALTQMVMQQLAIGRTTRDMPQASYGQIDRSNVSGTAMNVAQDAGAHHLLPHVKAYESAISHQYSQILMGIRNQGWLAKFGSSTVSPLMVPMQRTSTGQRPAFELDRGLIDKIGPRVRAKFSEVNTQDWVGLLNAAKLATEGKFAYLNPNEIREILTGETDYDRFLEEHLEYRATMDAVSHPKYAEMFTVPFMLAQQAQEAMADNPELAKMYLAMLKGWMENVAIQQQPMGGMLGGGPPMGAQGQAQGGPPPPPAGSIQLPPMAAGTSNPALGAGPGSQGAPVGRPPMGG